MEAWGSEEEDQAQANGRVEEDSGERLLSELPKAPDGEKNMPCEKNVTRELPGPTDDGQTFCADHGPHLIICMAGRRVTFHDLAISTGSTELLN